MAHPAGPPADLAPEALWRSLLPLRPTLPIDLKLSTVPDQALRVQAITSAHEMALSDLARQAPPEIRAFKLACGLVAATVHAGDALVFGSADDVADLYEDEITALANQVDTALERICPSYVRSDWHEWKVRLELGARHPTNTHLAWSLSQCCQAVAMSERVEHHPERYWGCPVDQLLDGHFMVYRSARTIYG